MNQGCIRVYHCLPAGLRSAAATLRGLYLRSWRYGRETERLIGEALEREHWNPQRWKQWQEERLTFVLNRAAKSVPYYRRYWMKRRRRGDNRSWEYIENWPVLEKESLRENSTAFLADDCSIRKMFHEHTSGTTGKPLDLWWSLKTVRTWYALFEARCRHWFGLTRHDRWALVGGQLVSSVSSRQPPFWVWNAALRQLYMSSYHLAPDLIPYYLDALQRYRIKYVVGYTSSLYALAEVILRLKRKDVQMAVAITNAEPVMEHQRNTISEAFQCDVRETYGMAEAVAAASECHDEHLHLWPEIGWVEVFQSNQPAPNGSSGELICTSLLNADMPLVRYRVGDSGALANDSVGCRCGRTLPGLASVEGRTDDVLYTADGRRIGRLDPVFKENLAVREVQILQESLNKLRVRYVPAEDFGPEEASLMIRRLRDRMGAVEVLLEATNEIPREANGKFRAVICQIPEEEKQYLGRLQSFAPAHIS